MTAVSRAMPMAWSSKAEGLGLGGIQMPVELGGSQPGTSGSPSLQYEKVLVGGRARRSEKTAVFQRRRLILLSSAEEASPLEARYHALRTTTRHTPSHSSPPSLAPYVASLPQSKSTSSLSVSLNAAPTPVIARKHSLQNVSGDMISYPMVSRIDLAPTYTAPSTVPPIPTQVKTPKEIPATTPSLDSKSTIKPRPPPIRVATSNHASFLTPFKGRFGPKDKEKEPSPVKEKPIVELKDKTKVKAKKTKAESRIEEVSPFLHHFPPFLSNPSALPPSEQGRFRRSLSRHSRSTSLDK
jgi:hypothetical protein